MHEGQLASLWYTVFAKTRTPQPGVGLNEAYHEIAGHTTFPLVFPGRVQLASLGAAWSTAGQSSWMADLPAATRRFGRDSIAPKEAAAQALFPRSEAQPVALLGRQLAATHLAQCAGDDPGRPQWAAVAGRASRLAVVVVAVAGSRSLLAGAGARAYLAGRMVGVVAGATAVDGELRSPGCPPGLESWSTRACRVSAEWRAASSSRLSAVRSR